MVFRKKVEAFRETHKELYKKAKSNRLFSHFLGGYWGGYVEMWEFENLSEGEESFNKVMQSEYRTTLYPEFANLIVAGSDTFNIWKSVP